VGALIRQSGWPVERTTGGFTAPFGPWGGETPPWRLYRVVFHTAIGQGDEGASRWRFARCQPWASRSAQSLEAAAAEPTREPA
jgi:hypothetical protein